MTDGLVSVIVNVYNCKEYLPTSLGSVRKQTYQNLEVILVDDCSTDGSGEFCDEYCKQDPRFRVIHHEKNTGVSGPRNTGLCNAHGEYIYFMDADDYMHAEMIERLFAAIQETGIGLAVCDLSRTSSLTNDIHRPVPDYKCELIPTEQVVFEMLSRVELKWCVSWSKLFKRELIEGLYYNDYYSIQDQDFNIRVYQRLEKLVFLPVPLYWYYRNPGSLQRNASLNAKRFYFNTMYRFRLLDHILPGMNEKKYRAWIIDYGYRQMLQRREIVKGTEYEKPFELMSRSVQKQTNKEYIFNCLIPIKKKVRFVFFWNFDKAARFYLKKRYGNDNLF